jgi:drug/metabolite transporter (DMT)-like permease
MLGEWANFELSHVSQAAWLSLIYLITAGSVLAFTAYVWLIQHHSATRVGTYAYVNPLVAMGLGYLLADEPLGARTIIGAACILISVVMISLMPERRSGQRS